jgi:predicted Zn-dependent protease
MALPPRARRRLRLVAALALAALACACAGSGSGGSHGQRTVLLTEQDEVRAGRQDAAAVESQIGVLDDPALTAYVTGIGERLLRGAPRRPFAFSFRIADQMAPNAFALPGGYVFVSRGLLLLANGEDELACVMGHEIAHVLDRHAARQQALARSENPLAAPWTRAAQMAAYSRDMEREADSGGQLLCAAAGYDPRALARMLQTLQQEERLRAGYSRSPGWFDTHPGSGNRAAAASVQASEIRWEPDPSLGAPRAALLRHIDGLEVGPRPENGFFEGRRFVHPLLGFQLLFPVGWRTVNQPALVGAQEPQGRALVYLTTAGPARDAREAAEAWVQKAGRDQRLTVRESKPVRVGHIAAWRLRVETRSREGATASWVTFIPYGKATYCVVGLAPAWSAGAMLDLTLETARSFAPLPAGARGPIPVERLRIATARPGETVAALGRRTGDAWDPTTTAIYNGVFPDHVFAGGERVKIARRETWTPTR